jgi:hypothetical protein
MDIPAYTIIPAGSLLLLDNGNMVLVTKDSEVNKDEWNGMFGGFDAAGNLLPCERYPNYMFFYYGKNCLSSIDDPYVTVDEIKEIINA